MIRTKLVTNGKVISADAATAALLSELDGFFTVEEEQKKRFFFVENFDFTLTWFGDCHIKHHTAEHLATGQLMPLLSSTGSLLPG